MTDETVTVAAGPSPILSAALDMARSLLFGLGTPLLAQGYVTGQQWQAMVGGLLALLSAVWSYAAAHPSKTSALASLMGLARAGGSPGAWNGDVERIAVALVPHVEKMVDAQIRARTGILAGPLDRAANTAIQTAVSQGAAHLKI